MDISKALRWLLILLLLNITFFFGHVTSVKPCPPPPTTVKPCPPPPPKKAIVKPCPPPPQTKQGTNKCPRDTLKFGVCGSWLGLVHEVIGTPPSKECCSLVKGLVDLEAAVCLCTALKTSLLGVTHVKIPVALTLLLNSCGKNVPQGFVC